MTTEEAIRSFIEAKPDLSPFTLAQYHRALDYLKRESPEMPEKPEVLRRALNQVKSVWVKDAHWRTWRVFFRWCHWEYDTHNPMERVERPKPPKIEIKALEPLELANLLAATGDNTIERAIVSLSLDPGVRASEFGRIHVRDVGSDTIKLLGKGGKQVSVPISPETYHLLQLLKNGGSQDLLLFPSRDGLPLSRFAVYRIVRKCMRRAGIPGPKLGSHILRHSLGANYIAAGGDPFSLMKIMRHENIATTEKYVNLPSHVIIERHHQFSPLREAMRGAQGVLIKREVEEILEKKEDIA